MVAAAVASRSRLDTHRAQSLHSVGMILMAGLVAVSTSHGSHGRHAGMSVDIGAVSAIAAGLFAVASVVVARKEWSAETGAHRALGTAHHGAMAASVVLMAVVATA
jgi:drug/metabolite transporter (DMT)-like permease